MVLALLLLFLNYRVGALYLCSKVLLRVRPIPVLEVLPVDGGGFDRVNFLYFGVLLCLIATARFGLAFQGLCFLEPVLILLLVAAHLIYSYFFRIKFIYLHKLLYLMNQIISHVLSLNQSIRNLIFSLLNFLSKSIKKSKLK